MRSFFTFLLFAIGILGSALAQNKVTGVVKDTKQKPLPNATILLLNAKDSQLVKTSISAADGSFEINTSKKGNFLLCYSTVGFEKKYSTVFALADNTNYAADPVDLKVASKKLDDVTVTVSKKPLVEVKADKMVFNVESSINSTGSDAMELLRKSPGISVDNNDNISMKGKTGVKIYVDGKMMQLDNSDLAAYLKSINSNDIEAIEMISNPSAKYDASGNAGVINIRLKKNKKMGMNGSVNAGIVQGVTPKGNGSVNLNFRNNKFNLFGNAGVNVGRNENLLYFDRIQNDSTYLVNSTNHDDKKTGNIKVGVDYFANKTNTFGVMATVNSSQTDLTSSTNTDIYSNPTSGSYGNYIKTLKAFNNGPDHRTNANFNANYRFADTLGTEINVDADYGLFRRSGNNFQPNYYINYGGALLNAVINQTETPTNIDIYTTKIDVDKNAWKGKLGFGAKFSYVKTDNTYDFYNQQSGTLIKQLDKSNFFSYKENVNAAYINYQRNLNTKWSIQLGLRTEQTNSEGKLTRADGVVQADNTVTKNYLDFFPSAAITWNLHPKHSLNLNYSRRIDRPNYTTLNPFELKLSELSFRKGNAFLRPQYTDNVQLTHTLMGFINTSIGYSYVQDYSTQTTDTIRNATYVQTKNVATQQIWSASIGSPLMFAKWWSGYANIWYNYQIFKGSIGNNKLTLDIPLYGLYVQNTFILGKNYTAEASGWFNGKSIWGASWHTQPMGSIDLGLQKQFWNKLASLKLGITDLLQTGSSWHARSNFGGLNIHGYGTFEARTVRITFSYRFGNNQLKASRERKAGLEKEAERAVNN